MRTILLSICKGTLIFCVVVVHVVHAHDIPGVRARSFGGAYRAVASANDTIYYNPAGLIKYGRMAVEADYLALTSEKTQNLTASVVDSTTTSWGLGLAYNTTFVSKDQLNTSHLVNLALAMPLVTERFLLGSSLYYFYDPKYENNRHFFNMDVGLMACLPIGLTFGVVVDHLINPKAHEKGIGLSFATAFNLGDLVRDVPLTLSFDWLMNDLKSKENLDHVIASGAEYILFDVLPLRVGLTSKLKYGDNLISLGSGLLIGGFALDGLYQQHLTVGKIRNFWFGSAL